MEDEEICKIIGCTGTDQKCPGNKNCDIIKKIKQCQEDMASKFDIPICSAMSMIFTAIAGEILTQKSLKDMKKLSRPGIHIDRKTRRKINWFLFLSNLKLIPGKIKNFFSRKAQGVVLEELERGLKNER